MRGPVFSVAIIAAALRLAALAHTPLVITNDGVGYASWAVSLLDGGFPDLPVFRTPGYPLFLAGVFAVAGIGAVPVLVAHHALGVAACAMIAATSRRIAGPTAGLICGMAAAADARLLGMECYLLTETLATFLLVLSVWLATGTTRPGLRAACLGAALASLCLVRPAFQVTVPLLVAALVLSAGPIRHARTSGLVCAAVLGLMPAPWLAHNAGRGIAGLSGASSVFFWMGAYEAGLIDGHVAPPPRVREAYDRLLAGEPPGSDRLYAFLTECGAWSDPQARAALSRWTLETIRAQPGGYAAAVGRTVLLQLDVGSKELPWSLRRLSRPARLRADAPNFQFHGEQPGMEPFAMHGKPGPAARLIGVLGASKVSGAMNVLLLIAAAGAGVLCVLRRRWAWAFVLAATGAYFGAHVLTLLPYSRFSLPVWVCWYIAPAVLLALRRRGDDLTGAAECARSASMGGKQKNNSRPGGREP